MQTLVPRQTEQPQQTQQQIGSQKQSSSLYGLADTHSLSTAQRQRQESADNSAQATQLQARSRMMAARGQFS